ncbi:hypothetical protein AAC387_Pa02g3523 [Persea americana]
MGLFASFPQTEIVPIAFSPAAIDEDSDLEMEAESNTVGNTNCSSSDSKKDSNPCPICLRSIHEDAYLDRCFHKLCYDCIAHWAKLVASKHRSSSKSSLLCPLCKGENLSIIHGCDGHSYQQHFISQDLEKGSVTWTQPLLFVLGTQIHAGQCS